MSAALTRDRDVSTSNSGVLQCFYLTKQNRCLSVFSKEREVLPPEVIVGHVKVFQCEQEVIKGLCRNFDQLVVVDDQMLQID